MKKRLLASLLATFGCAALAQSSVTLFGVLDSTVQRATQGGASITRLNGNGGNQFSRFGLRGVEDLGGGTSVGFVLDAGLSIDTGTGGATSADNVTAQAASGLVFNRRSTVSAMSQDWGEVRLGRDFVPTYWNLTLFDPFGTAGSGSVNNLAQGALTRSSTIQTAVRASNTIGYFLPALGGFYGQAMVAFAENQSNPTAATKNDGRYAAVRLGYAKGPLNVAASYGNTNLASGDVSTRNFAASYDFGVARAMVQHFRDQKELVAAPSRSHGWLVGTQIVVGVGYIPISYTTVKDNTPAGRGARQMAAGYVHNLSKRTALYGTYSRLQNRNGAALTGGGVPGVANTTWSGIDLGIRHTF